MARVNEALAGLNRGPGARVRAYQDAKRRFQDLQDRNWGFLFGMKAGGAAPGELRRVKALQALGELDALLSAFPPEVRGKIGGYTTLANVGTGDKALADFFINRIRMIDRELERILKDEWNTEAVKLFKRSKPQRDLPGQKPKGKFGATVHDLFRTLEEATEWTEEEATDHADKLWAKINRGEISPEEEAHLQLEAELVPLFANWKNADSDRMDTAVTTGNQVLTKAYRAERAKIIARRDRQMMIRFDLKQAAGTEGGKPARIKQEIKDTTAKGGARAVFLNLASFDHTMSYLFGERAPVVRDLVKREREADATKTRGINDKLRAFSDLLTKLAGGDAYAGQRLGYSLTQKTATIKYRRPGMESEESYQFSQEELATITMNWMQARGREHLLGMLDDRGASIGTWHYNEEFVAAAEKALSEEMRAVRDFLLKQYADGWGPLNDVYSRLNGINLPQNKNYSPLALDPLMTQNASSLDPSTGEVVGAGARSPSFLKNRGGGLAEPNFDGAIQLWKAHMIMSEHWKAYAELAADLTPVLNHREIRNAAKAIAGNEAPKIVGMRLDWMHKGGEITAANRLRMMQIFSNAMNRMAAMALFGRATVLMVQVTQLAAASSKMPVGAYLSRLSRLFAGRLKWKESFRSDFIKLRIEQQPVQVQVAMRGLFSDKPGRIKNAAQVVGNLISDFDGFYTAGTYAMIYDYQRSLGLSHEQASEEAERGTEEVAQPTRPGTRSMWEVTNTSALARSAFAFASEARKNVAFAWFSYAKRNKTAGHKAAVYLIASGIISEVLRTIWRDLRDDDDDDEWFDEKNWGDPMRFLAAGMTDWLYGVPILGEAGERAINKLLGVHTFDRGGIYGGVVNAAPAIRRAPESVADLWAGEADWGDIMRDVNSILSAMGLFNNQFAAVATLSTPIKDIVQITDAQTGD
jgi:hypothetical protein